MKLTRTRCRSALKAGADIDYPNKSMANATPLHIAIMSKQVEAVKKLLKEKANIDSRTIDKRTPLMTAAETGSEPIFIAIYDAKPDVDATDAEGNTAQTIARLAAAEASDPDQKQIFENIATMLDKD